MVAAIRGPLRPPRAGPWPRAWTRCPAAGSLRPAPVCPLSPSSPRGPWMKTEKEGLHRLLPHLGSGRTPGCGVSLSLGGPERWADPSALRLTHKKGQSLKTRRRCERCSGVEAGNAHWPWLLRGHLGKLSRAVNPSSNSTPRFINERVPVTSAAPRHHGS